MKHQDIIDRAEGKYIIRNTNREQYQTASTLRDELEMLQIAAIEAATHEREQHTFGFAEWLRLNCTINLQDKSYMYLWNRKTTSELFAIYMQHYLTEKSKDK